MTTNEPPPGDGADPGRDQTDPYGSPASDGLPAYGSVPPPPGSDLPPPAPAGPDQRPFSAPDAISWGWRMFVANIGGIIVAGLLVVGVSVAFSAIGLAITGVDTGFDQNAQTSAGATIASTLVQLASTVVSILLSAVIIRAALDVADGGRFELGSAFSRVPLLKALVASILVSILVTVGFVLLILPGIVLYFLTYFTMYFVVDEPEKSSFAAIGDSIRLIGSNVGDSLLLALLNVLVIIAGFLALCVGLFVAYPITLLASVYAFRRFRGQPVAAI